MGVDRGAAIASWNSWGTLLEAVQRANEVVGGNDGLTDTFDGILAELLAQTGSAYGFIGEVLRDDAGSPFLKTYAITNIAWDDETRAFFSEHAPTGMEFRNLDTLFGWVLREGRPLIANTPASDPRRGGLPAGHPPLDSFLGVPIWSGGELVAMAGLANRPGGYDDALVDSLGPMLAAIGQLTLVWQRKGPRGVDGRDKKNQETDAQLRELVASLPQLAWTCRPDGSCDYLSAEWLDYTGVPEAEQLGYGWANQLHRDDREQAVAAWQAALATGNPVDLEFRARRHDGVHRWFRSRGVAFRGDGGRIVKWFGSVTDIEDVKRAEAMLARLELLAEHVPGSICQFRERPDGTFHFPYASKGIRDLYGFTAEEAAEDATPVLSRVHPDDREAMATSIAASREQMTEWHLVFRLNHPDGRLIWVEGNSTPQKLDDGSTIWHGWVRDVTERRRVEEERRGLAEQLQHAQKMDAVGRLAGGVAHDFNNILGGILGGLSLLEMDLPGEAEHLRADVRDMQALVKRGADLARQLLGFSRRGRYDVRPLDLRDVTERTAELYGRTRRDVAIARDWPAGLWPVLMDHAQLEQVLLNLFLNAGHAMPGGGRIDVRAENVDLSGGATVASGVAAGRYVRVQVTDTGAGMDEETRARVFEPFFTTRASGEGTGLGLASVYGIVTNHGGQVTVDSAPGRGATFTILLPATDPLPAADVTAPHEAPRRGHGTILVVDDELQMRTACAHMLSKMGYSVIAVGTGREAVEVVRGQRDAIALTVLDLTMPEMSGAQTVATIHELAPAMKVLLMSGFSDQGIAQELLARDCDAFLQKPFDVAALSEKVQALIG